jgi:hypothetical protein
MEDSYQHKENMLEESKEMRESHIFITKYLCECVYEDSEDDGIGQEDSTRKNEKDQQIDPRQSGERTRDKDKGKRKKLTKH